jgi:hypothetical protein
VRHATADDLERLGDLLEALRAMPGLTERRPGYFSREGRAFVHFHVDGSDLYADAKLGGERFERVRVTSAQDQRAFARRVRDSIRGSAR